MNPREKCFFKVCLALTEKRIYTIREVMGMFDGVIPERQMLYYLKKWAKIGFYDYGTTIDLGWIIGRNVPSRYFEK